MIANRIEAYLQDRRRYQIRTAQLKERKTVIIAAETTKDHNQPVPAPEAMITVLLSEMRRSQDEAANSNGSMRATYAKAEAKGINLAAAKRALKIQKSGKAGAFAADLTELLRYLNILGVGVQKSQLDLFEVAPVLAPIHEKAALDGLSAGRFGEPADEAQADVEDEEPFGGPWPDDKQIAAQAAE